MATTVVKLGSRIVADDAEDVRQALRDFVQATNARDGDELCGELLTQEYLEKYTGATGDDARDQCRELLDATQEGLSIELVEVKRVRVDGDRARVTTTVRTNSGETEQTYTLVKQDGDFRVTSSTDTE